MYRYAARSSRCYGYNQNVAWFKLADSKRIASCSTNLFRQIQSQNRSIQIGNSIKTDSLILSLCGDVSAENSWKIADILSDEVDTEDKLNQGASECWEMLVGNHESPKLKPSAVGKRSTTELVIMLKK
eukprot:GHVL01002106.1.p1 GENE.GHVL01002106.1~~GHVL01002106.1.p1  ORF type:complete len:128 (-),score=10.17 GHVL01002106.1:11-394(-)